MATSAGTEYAYLHPVPCISPALEACDISTKMYPVKKLTSTPTLTHISYTQIICPLTTAGEISVMYGTPAIALVTLAIPTRNLPISSCARLCEEAVINAPIAKMTFWKNIVFHLPNISHIGPATAHPRKPPAPIIPTNQPSCNEVIGMSFWIDSNVVLMMPISYPKTKPPPAATKIVFNKNHRLPVVSMISLYDKQFCAGGLMYVWYFSTTDPQKPTIRTI